MGIDEHAVAVEGDECESMGRLPGEGQGAGHGSGELIHCVNAPGTTVGWGSGAKGRASGGDTPPVARPTAPVSAAALTERRGCSQTTQSSVPFSGCWGTEGR